MEEIIDTSFKFNLGSEVKDEITGFVGIVTGRHQWLNNCNTYTVQPTKLKDGAPQPTVNFDQPQLMLVVKDVVKPDQRTGGPAREVQTPNR